jgi:glycosyltransferase involved in cell wall biosynthesis
LKKQSDISLLIGGDGQLRSDVENYLREKNLDNVNLVGWIPHEKLPNYLNQLKLIVLPSYTEGLPNIMLEAMACGTPVLATPVGSMVDVIKDCETGFIMENNSPECITNNVIRALEYPDIDIVAKNAKEFVMKEFTFERTFVTYKKILDRI